MNRSIQGIIQSHTLAQARVELISLKTYIYYSTMVGVFSNAARIHVPFAIRLFDGIMLTNILLIFLFRIIDINRVASWVLWFIFYLAMSGVIGIARGVDTVPWVTKEFLGTSVSLLYYYYFFKMFDNDFEKIFLTYARIAYWFAIAAFPLFAIISIDTHQYERLQGLASEPAAFCEIVLPAYYWFARSYFTTRKHGREFAVFTLAIVLSGSALGFLSSAFGALLLLTGRRKHLLAVPVVVGGLLAVIYTSSSDFKMRVDDTLLAASSMDVTGSNLSTFSLISSALVTRQVLKESPIIGNGIGSHPTSHARFIKTIPGSEAYINMGLGDLSSADAGSMTFRVLSEFGISGLLGVLYFIFHFYVGGTSINANISNAILTIFFVKLIRGGIYFTPEQFLFVIIYMLNYQQFKRRVYSEVRHEGGSFMPSAKVLKV
jgi:hypothetical protein